MTVSHSAGRLSLFSKAWSDLTSDFALLEWVRGYKIPFVTSPVQLIRPVTCRLKTDIALLSPEVESLIRNGAIVECSATPGNFVSIIFLEPKTSGGVRVILNLKGLNAFISGPHFKIEDHRTAVFLMTPGCALCTLDLKDAYYLVSIHQLSRKYLQFYFKDRLYKFTSPPFGLCTAPWVYTNLLKPVLSNLRNRGYLSVANLDNFLLLAPTSAECVDNAFSRLAYYFNLWASSSPRRSAIFHRWIAVVIWVSLSIPSP